MMAVANYLAERQVDSPAFEGVVLATIMLLGLLILRLYVFWGEPLLSLRWLRFAFFAADPRRVETLLVLATLGYLWFRAVTFLQRDISFFVIGYDFRKGVLGLILGVSLYTVLSHQSPILFVYSFFFFSLIAVALGRVEDKAQATGGSGRPFGPGWVGLLAASSVLVLALGAVISGIWSLSGFQRFGQTNCARWLGAGPRFRDPGPGLLASARTPDPMVDRLHPRKSWRPGPIFANTGTSTVG